MIETTPDVSIETTPDVSMNDTEAVETIKPSKPKKCI